MTRTVPTLLVLSALGLSTIAQPAAAQVLHEGVSHDPSKIVTYTRIDNADIDASTGAGARVLLQRIERAADAVCGGAGNATTKSARHAYADCRDDAIRGAVSKMGSKPLTQLARTRQHELLAAR